MDKKAEQSSPTQHDLFTLRDSWSSLPLDQRSAEFANLPQPECDDFFLSLDAQDQAELIMAMPPRGRRFWLHLLAPDDLADVIQVLDPENRDALLENLDIATRKEVTALLAYDEDDAGGLMNPRFSRVRPDMRVGEALEYLRRQAPKVETLRYIYVLDAHQVLLGVVSLRHLFVSQSTSIVKDIMRTNVITAAETMSQEEIKNLLTKSALDALPIVDEAGRMKGVVTVDDIVEVVEEEATKDIHMLGGSKALDEHYLNASVRVMIKKRAGWLVILFLGEMLTATAMGYFEHEIERAIVLALFIPLIISSGGNAGSQASTLVVRAIALNETRLRDWWRIFIRELLVGSILGGILGLIGFCRIFLWPTRMSLYGEHYMLIGATVALSLVGIVLWGSLMGSMFPLLLKKARLDPATASAPFVATMVDVSGLIIYFTVASILLKGTLL